jgi:hypothetical protein
MKSTNDQISASDHLDGVPSLGRRRMLLWLALLIAIGLALWVQWPRLTNPNSIQDDFRGNYWFNLFQEPDLYPADLNPTNYRNSDLQLLGVEVGLLVDILNSVRGGYHLLFFLASPLIPPILFNKLLIFPLVLIAAYYAFRIGQELKEEWTGFALAVAFVVFNLAAADTISVAAGLPRSFASPILLALIYYLMMRRYLAAGIVVAVAGIIYAPVFVLSLATFVLAVLEAIKAGRIKFRLSWQIVLPLLALGAVSLVMLPRIAGIVSNFWINLTTNSTAWGLLSDPTYGPGGRYRLFREYPFVGLGGIFTRIGPFWQATVLFFLALGTWLLVPRRERIFPIALRQLLIAAVACFAFAWAAIILASSLTLYYPSRYLRATLPIVFLIFTVTNLEQALASARLRFESLTPALRLTTLLVLATWTVTLAFLLGQHLSPFLNTIPNRRVAWLLLFASAFSIGALSLFIFGSVQVDQEPGKLSGSRRPVTILVICLLAVFGAFYTVGPSQQHNYIPLSNSQLEFLDFVQTLPKDVKFASSSCLLENIPMVARRQVLWDCEDRPNEVLITDTLKATYAQSLDEVFNFCQQYKVDYFVIEKKALEESRIQRRNYFSEPYNSILNAAVTSQAGYVLEDIPDRMRVYEDENVIVMQCKLDDMGELASQATQVDGVGILALDEISDTVSQSGEVEMTVKWRADKELPADYDVCFSVKDRSGENRQKVCESLSPDMPASQWSISEVRYETYDFRLSPYLESGDYSIVATVNSGEESGNSSGIVLGEITYAALPRTFNTAEINPETDYDAIWDDVIGLANYDVSESKSNTLELNVRWHALRRMAESYKIFLHLREAGTDVIAGQVDRVPRNWAYPTNWWEANEIISDTLSMSLDDLGLGRFELWLGFYNEESGERLPLADLIDPTLPIEGEAVKIHEFERSDLGRKD